MGIKLFIPIFVLYLSLSFFFISSVHPLSSSTTNDDSGTHSIATLIIPTSISFLLSVNLTYSNCFSTVPTGPLTRLEKTSVIVGQCDNGPIVWNTTENKDEIVVTFYSSVIVDASPPSCLIKNFMYGNPVATSSQPLLPSCFDIDSREGYHMTYYWFTAITWN